MLNRKDTKRHFAASRDEETNEGHERPVAADDLSCLAPNAKTVLPANGKRTNGQANGNGKTDAKNQPKLAAGLWRPLQPIRRNRALI